MNRQISELPTKEYTHEHLDKCFYVEFDESGAPLYRVNMMQLFNMIKDKALISGMRVCVDDNVMTIHKIDDKEFRATRIKKSAMFARKAIEDFKKAYEKLPKELK